MYKSIIQSTKSKTTGFKRGFTLIEVAFSLAIVAVALISVIGLLSVFLRGTKDTVDRQEALSVCQSLNTYLQNQGFDTAFTWVQQGQTVPQLYACNIPVDNTGTLLVSTPGSPPAGATQMVMFQSTDANFSKYITNRLGRLYFVSISLSSNVPIHIANNGPGPGGISTLFNQTSLPSGCYAVSTAKVSGGSFTADSNFYADADLTLSVRVYALPPSLAPITGTPITTLETTSHIYPILTYDTTVNR